MRIERVCNRVAHQYLALFRAVVPEFSVLDVEPEAQDTSNRKIIGRFSRNDYHFAERILHPFCIFNRKFEIFWHLDCNSQYGARPPRARAWQNTQAVFLASLFCYKIIVSTGTGTGPADCLLSSQPSQHSSPPWKSRCG